MFAKNGPTLFELLYQALCSTQRGYDLLAPKFDLTPFRTPDELVQHAVSVIGQADDALDVCCGTGVGMKFLHPICKRRLVGIDFSAGMLSQARQKLANCSGTAEVQFIEQDVMKMTFRGEFDVITCFGALGHVIPGEENIFLHRIYDALKPGGRFVTFTADAPSLFSVSGILVRGFDAVMKIRNLLLKPPFVMYYSTLRLPQLLKTLEAEHFIAQIHPTPFPRLHLVVASRANTK